MTQAEIQSSFATPVLFADASYARPTLRWLQGQFWDAFRQDRWAKVGSYSRKNDCDNWARAFAQLAQDSHAQTRSGSDDEALAVGEFFYTKASGEGHAINAAFTDVGLVFIEPQNGLTLKLTTSEILSCFFVRF